MKINIDSKLRNGGYGGGNQFLKALGKEFNRRGVMASSVNEADVVLFNSYQGLRSLLKTFLFDGRKKRIWRLGPEFSIHRKGSKWKLLDRLTVFLASLIVHGVIFQSQWSYTKARQLGFFKKKNVFVITNAVDATIFYRKATTQEKGEGPIRLVYTSWSTNKNKGFSYLQFLDKHLNRNTYHLTFIGNSPVTFTHIETRFAVSSELLADELRASDIFISPTKDDACSNAIIEALSCGLPVVALNSGGNPELVGRGGLLFSTEKELLTAIDKVANNLSEYRNAISVKTIESVAEEYITAIRASIK